MGYYEPGFSFFSPVFYIKIEVNYGSLSRDLTVTYCIIYGLFHTLNVSRIPLLLKTTA